MKNKNVYPAPTRFTSTMSIKELELLYSTEPLERKQDVLSKLGPLQHVFLRFLEHEQHLDPLDEAELKQLFDHCSDPTRTSDQLYAILHMLAPGNGRVGFAQVNMLADHLRTRVAGFLAKHHYYPEELLAHDHVFGSGGDFCKTIHASTTAAIIAAPLVRICKTGTTNVTSYHGSAQAMTEIGYDQHSFDIAQANHELSTYNFSFVPLSALGFPYSDALKAARGRMWHEAMNRLIERCPMGAPAWQETMRTTDVDFDIFKIVSPNAQVLHPQHHSTGVCHIGMIPYVLALYLHLHSQGFIVHSYDGIDELSNASSNPDENHCNNLLIHVTADQIVISECTPEDLGLPRANLRDIQEEEDLSATYNDFWRIISCEDQGAKRDFVVANAALLLLARQAPARALELTERLRASVDAIKQLLDSGTAERNFRALLQERENRAQQN